MDAPTAAALTSVPTAATLISAPISAATSAALTSAPATASTALMSAPTSAAFTSTPPTASAALMSAPTFAALMSKPTTTAPSPGVVAQLALPDDNLISIPTEGGPHLQPATHPTQPTLSFIPPIIPSEGVSHLQPTTHLPPPTPSAIPPIIPSEGVAHQQPATHPPPPTLSAPLPTLPSEGVAHLQPATQPPPPTLSALPQNATTSRMALDDLPQDSSDATAACRPNAQPREAPPPIARPLQALTALIEGINTACRNFSADRESYLVPLVLAALAECDNKPAMLRVLVEHGWNNKRQRFEGWGNMQLLASRLRHLTYKVLQECGRGAYAVVYKAVDQVSGQYITLKSITMERHGGDGLPSTAIREISLLRELQHDNIVRLRDVVMDDGRILLVMDYLDMDLEQHINTPGVWSLDNVRRYMYGILKGIAHAHKHRILHRDLKLPNILVDHKTNTVKVADFGLARCFTPLLRPYTHEVVTLWYRAPEIILGETHYGTPIDIWSIGCIFAELVNRRPLFPGDSEIGQLYRIFETMGTPDDDTWPGVSELCHWQPLFPDWGPKDLRDVVPDLRRDLDAIDLLSRMLEYEPSKRITARQALKHPYFAKERFAESGAIAESSGLAESAAIAESADLAESAVIAESVALADSAALGESAVIAESAVGDATCRRNAVANAVDAVLVNAQTAGNPIAREAGVSMAHTHPAHDPQARDTADTLAHTVSALDPRLRDTGDTLAHTKIPGNSRARDTGDTLARTGKADDCRARGAGSAVAHPGSSGISLVTDVGDALAYVEPAGSLSARQAGEAEAGNDGNGRGDEGNGRRNKNAVVNRAGPDEVLNWDGPGAQSVDSSHLRKRKHASI